MEGKKLRSLLRFYKNQDIEIELKVNLKKGIVIKGNIVKLSHIFRKYFILQSKNGSKIKVFLEDVIKDSIIPIDFIGTDKEKSKSGRSPISLKLRMAVFKRDKFVCQYCGACGPNVELEIDHVLPVSRGGTDEISNLKTSCFNCNRGKGDIIF